MHFTKLDDSPMFRQQVCLFFQLIFSFNCHLYLYYIYDFVSILLHFIHLLYVDTEYNGSSTHHVLVELFVKKTAQINFLILCCCWNRYNAWKKVQSHWGEDVTNFTRDVESTGKFYKLLFSLWPIFCSSHDHMFKRPSISVNII